MKDQMLATTTCASSSGSFANTGNGPGLVPIDIGHSDYFGLVDPETAFWSLVKKDHLSRALTGDLWSSYRKKTSTFREELHTLRFQQKPTAVYFNPTERCNLNCPYCYIPEKMRRNGEHMTREKLLEALDRLGGFFKQTLEEGTKPEIIFHGAEPLLNRDALCAGIEAYTSEFRFGIQTNATLLEQDLITFFQNHEVSIGLSLDSAEPLVANQTRKTWAGEGVYDEVLKAMDALRGSEDWSVICTISNQNMESLTQFVEFLHRYETPTCLLNGLRCTLPSSRNLKPQDKTAAHYYLAALDRCAELYQETGRKMVVANFANILLAIIAPTARRLMCDISPCGAGRCFIALAPNGDIFPCSEFIGLPDFCGGNLFKDPISTVLDHPAFRKVTSRCVEDIDPCRHCAIRHFCGAPCPAEAHELHQKMNSPGAFCELYEEQVRYAFCLLADGREESFLWNDWDEDVTTTFQFTEGRP